MGVRDRGCGAHITAIGIRKGQRHNAHQRTIAVIPLAIQTRTPIQCRGNRQSAVEDKTVDSIFAVMQPGPIPSTHVIDVHPPLIDGEGIQRGEHHAGIVRPSAHRLIVRAKPRHLRTPERIPDHEFIGHAQSIADGLPIHGRSQLFECSVHQCRLPAHQHSSSSSNRRDSRSISTVNNPDHSYQITSSGRLRQSSAIQIMLRSAIATPYAIAFCHDTGPTIAQLPSSPAPSRPRSQGGAAGS